MKAAAAAAEPTSVCRSMAPAFLADHRLRSASLPQLSSPTFPLSLWPRHQVSAHRFEYQARSSSSLLRLLSPFGRNQVRSLLGLVLVAAAVLVASLGRSQVDPVSRSATWCHKSAVSDQVALPTRPISPISRCPLESRNRASGLVVRRLSLSPSIAVNHNQSSSLRPRVKATHVRLARRARLRSTPLSRSSLRFARRATYSSNSERTIDCAQRCARRAARMVLAQLRSGSPATARRSSTCSPWRAYEP